MNNVSVTLSQASSNVASFLIMGLPLGPTFDNVSKAAGFLQVSILRYELVLPGSKTSRFGLEFFKGNKMEFVKLGLCKEFLIAGSPSNGLDEGRPHRFAALRPFGHLLGGF